MALEIERKFLVKDDSWRSGVTKTISIVQGYLSKEPVLRIRKSEQGTFLAVKSKGAGLARGEWEYPIPEKDFFELMELAYGKIFKVRYHVPFGKHLWEIDVFVAPYANLVVAEVELSSVDEVAEMPPWVGEEVTLDYRYTNAAMADLYSPRIPNWRS